MKKEEIATDLMIVRRDHTGSLYKNGGVPLCYTGVNEPAIRICSEGWNKMIKINRHGNASQYFSRNEGIHRLSFAISHETVHQVVGCLEGDPTSQRLDCVSGAGELV